MEVVFAIIVGVIILGVFIALLVKVLEMAENSVDGDALECSIAETNESIDDLINMIEALEQKVDYADELRVAEAQRLQENINRKANGITKRINGVTNSVNGVTKTVQGMIRGVEWKEEE